MTATGNKNHLGNTPSAHTKYVLGMFVLTIFLVPIVFYTLFAILAWLGVVKFGPIA